MQTYLGTFGAIKLLTSAKSAAKEIQMLGDIVEMQLSNLQDEIKLTSLDLRSVYEVTVVKHIQELMMTNLDLGTLHTRLAKDVWDDRNQGMQFYPKVSFQSI
jgi:hypothetical protein